MFRHLTRKVGLAAFFLVVQSLGAASITNGSFEDLGSYVNTPGADSMSGVAADGWSISANTPDWFLGAPGPAGLWSTPWGNFFAVAAAEGAGYREGFSQTISGLTIGQSYRLDFQQANGLRFDQGSYLGVGTVGGWEVLLDGLSILSSNSLNDNSAPALAFTSDWNLSSVVFEATDVSQTIEFLAYGGVGSTPTFQFVDDVSITAVPEPTIGMMALLGSVMFARRRRG